MINFSKTTIMDDADRVAWVRTDLAFQILSLRNRRVIEESEYEQLWDMVHAPDEGNLMLVELIVKQKNK